MDGATEVEAAQKEKAAQKKYATASEVLNEAAGTKAGVSSPADEADSKRPLM